jgi:dihydrofolate synthase/folylpolyglutamate synthase
VIEVGLGGRLDATNVLTPELTICTDISFDHVEILGRSLKKIAGEKAGIIKKNVPHLIGMLPREAEKVMREKCRKMKAPLTKLTKNDFTNYPERFTLDFTSPQFSFKRLKPALIGTHQLTNAALALKALAILNSKGLVLKKSAIVRGMRTTDWPGRFQIIKRPNRPTYVLDVCHNAGGAEAFVASYKRRFPKHRPAIIIGLVKRKDHQTMFDSFWDIARRYMLVNMKTHRSVSPREMVETIDFKGIPFWRCKDLDSAIKQLLPDIDNDDIVAVIGSHYLVGEFLQKHGKS